MDKDSTTKVSFNYKNILIALGFLILLLGVIFILMLNKPADTTSNNSGNTSVTPSAQELKTEDIKIGNGKAAEKGNKITVNYVGTLMNGQKFDSSYDRNQPFTFILGEGDVIKGWDQGLLGMKVGGKRKLTIPSNLGYGSQGSGSVIPPNSTLIFEVELLKVE